jgi:hypothetical protein
MSRDIHVFTARMPVDEYEGLKAFAFLSQVSINEVVLTAIRSYLREQAPDDRLDAMVEEMKARLRRTTERRDD